ncbi:uncharacterized protein N7511_009033 [Penicillium nucicola]|uniref:uncharacterized protein n=1 Tax=Penicillium nucicola TaxID=1850975 RepID=UPI002545B86F|nr:uncharacterized protein N7511_009033 [Penicillium nucicola]KAJ5747337.1 hypothetical protein N7511_009033 [Penicillium nucicola]
MPKLLDQNFEEDSMIIVPDESEWDTIETTNRSDTIPAGTMATSSRLDDTLQQPTPGMELRPIEIVDSSLPVNTFEMLQAYFTYTHCWLPILEQHDLFRVVHTESSPEGQDNGSRLVIWAIVAYQSCMENDGGTTKPNIVLIEQSIHSRIMVESSGLRLGHVQALIILVLCRLKIGDISHAWRLVGLASRMLQTLPASLKQSRYCHTFHGCNFLDNILCALLRKSPSLSLEEQKQEGPVQEESMEEWNVWPSFQQGPGDDPFGH